MTPEEEKELLEQTDNGWQEGDPREQPKNPMAWHDFDRPR